MEKSAGRKTSDLLAVCSLPMRESGFIECIKASYGKQITVIYTIIVVTLASVLMIHYSFSNQLGIDLLAHNVVQGIIGGLLIIAAAYCCTPNLLGKVLYRRYITNKKYQYKTVFYADRIELQSKTTTMKEYSYALVKQIVRSENLIIFILSNLICLPVRSDGLTEAQWAMIQAQICNQRNIPYIQKSICTFHTRR